MKRLAWLLSVVAFILIFLFVDVHLLKDKRVFVPSPDNVAASFFEFLSSGHFNEARHLLSRNLQQKTSAEDLREFKKKLESRWGKIQRITDKKSEYNLSQALATVKLSTDRGRFQFQLVAVRESGLWRISGIQ